ncbi:hypothetical protein ACFLWH_00685 [Chloroflexota bacterium]
MKWHIAHRHEIPTAFDVLGKDYDVKVTNLREENALLKKKMEDFERKLSQAEIALIKEQAEELKNIAETIKLNSDIKTIAMAIAIRDNLIKEKLNIEMPNPFKSRD